MKDKLNFYIDGSWVKSESKEKIAVINPANEELIGHISSGTKDDINHLYFQQQVFLEDLA
jgi:acyl-CoA reductase-like NAD-dependent aldehyde dehydrogenase